MLAIGFWVHRLSRNMTQTTIIPPDYEAEVDQAGQSRHNESQLAQFEGAMARSLDPVTLEVLWNAFKATADMMGITVWPTAYQPGPTRLGRNRRRRVEL